VSGSLSQSIYYAKNILAAGAGANAVTVTFSVAAVSADIRILEYSGADPNNPVDVTAVGSGSSGTTSKSAAATTTNATDLIFGANIVVTSTKGPGSGFTKRLLTSPDGDIAEDKTVTKTGSYNATAPLTSSGAWIMQMVAFRTPILSSGSFTLSASPASVSVEQGGQGTSTITTAIDGGFNSSISLSASGVPAGTTVSFNPSTIAAPGAGSSTMTVAVGSSTAVGTYSLTVTGTGGGIQQSATVTLTVTADPSFALSASPASISVLQGSQGTSTITSTITGNFNSSISLSASGAPSGTTVSFNPSTIAAPGAGSSTMTVAVGSSTAAGTYSLTVTGTGGGIQQSATVTLTVTTQLSLNPTSTAFGNVVLSSDPSLPVIITNTGTSSVTISQTTVTGTGFSVSGLTLPFTLPGGQNTSLNVIFSPTAVGSFMGNVSIVSNAAGSPNNEPLSGTGIHGVDLTWTASTSPGVTGYDVYRGTSSGGESKTPLNTAPVSSTSYVDESVTAGTTYYYVVTAVANGTQSADSNEASATVPSP
jgi:Abnormal spindle-like microcephaly-assoc'd, ASPM-SPD-2-Hydin